MKRSIIITALILFFFAGYSQKKDSTAIQTDTLYAVVLKKAEFEFLVNLIRQNVDEKPSILNAWINENIYKKTQLVAPPKPKKENDLTKKK